MDLLMDRVEPDTIRMVGRWQSDMILRYLNTTENSFTKVLLAKIFEHDAYSMCKVE